MVANLITVVIYSIILTLINVGTGVNYWGIFYIIGPRWTQGAGVLIWVRQENAKQTQTFKLEVATSKQLKA